MAGRDLVDHSKSSWESLLPVAGVAAFVLVQRLKLNPIPKVALAGVCAGFTYGSLEKKTPKLGGALGGIMAAYAVLKGLEAASPGSHVAGVVMPRVGRGRVDPRGMGRGRMDPRGMPGRPAGRHMRNCFANVDVFGAVQDRHTCYPTKLDANNLTNGFPYPTCLPGGQIPDNQGGNNIPVPADPCPGSTPSGSPPSGSSPTATGLSWDEMEQATPDLAAAKRAAQIAWRSYMSMPGIGQAGYKLTKDVFFPEDTW